MNRDRTIPDKINDIFKELQPFARAQRKQVAQNPQPHFKLSNIGFVSNNNHIQKFLYGEMHLLSFTSSNYTALLTCGFDAD